MASTIAEVEQKPFALHPLREGLAKLFSAERRQWLLFAPVCLGLGIGLWFLLPWNAQRQAALLGALALALAGIAFSGQPRRLIVGAGLLVAMGIGIAEWRSAEVAAPRLHHRLTAAPIEGQVEQIIQREGGERVQIILRRDASSIDPEIRVRLSATGDLPPRLEAGARISAVATLAPIPGPSLPGGHDPSRRAWFERLSASGRIIGPVTVVEPAPQGDGWLDRARQRLSSHIAQTLGGDAGAIAAALTVGEQGRVRPQLLEAMRISGIAHLLSVSGFHVGVVVAGAYLLLRRLLALSPWLANRTSVARLAAIGAGLAGTAYVILSGAEVPAVRSLIGAWVVLVAMMLGRDPFSLRLIAFAAFIILLSRPEALLNPSFQLSFAAVTALVALSRSPLGQRLATGGPEEGLLPKAGRLLLALVLTGIVAEAILTPIALFHFGRTGAYGVFANILAIPLTSLVIMPLLGLWLFLSILGLGWLASWALVPALETLAAIATHTAAVPGATLSLPSVPLAPFLLIVAGALPLLLFEGRLRWAGLPLLAAGAIWAIAAPRPDLLISADGRQVAVVADGHLHTLRGHRGGFLASSWAEASGSPADSSLAEIPGASCTTQGCTVPLETGLVLVALTEDAPPRIGDCANADIIVSPQTLAATCKPRWKRIDQPVLLRSGAIAIHSASHRLETVGARAGDHPWSPSALPGERPRLLGSPAWTGVIAE